jgi:tetratricopeptide (TPR) repeat protein
MYQLRKYGFLACAMMMGLLQLAEAAPNFARTPEEEAMCQAMIYNNHDTSDRENWKHMHHFCDCMRFTNRAYAAIGNAQEVRYNLQNAIGGCNYVLGHTTADFYMRAEVHLQKGKALRLGGQENKAVGEFMEAIKGNPELALAYVELADIQARNKKFGEALKTVTEGLRHAPESKSLKRRYTELGGKLPYPEPLANKSSPAPAAAATPSAPQEQPTPAAVMPAEASVPANPAEKAADTTTSPPEFPKIGSPTNPWCRFCPDPVVKP